MKILILGSEGFIGHHLVAAFVKKGYEVEGCDLTEYFSPGYTYHKVSILSPDFDSIFTSEPFDVCINASGSGNVGFSIQHPQSDFEVNTNAVAKALDTIRKHQPSCRFLHISSAAVYGSPVSLPVTESAALAPLSPYGYHKQMSEMLCEEYYKIFGLFIAVIRPFSVFGNGLKKQLFWDICQKLQQSSTVSLFGTGHETRDFIHISDFISVIDIIVHKSPFKFDIYNAATGTSTSIKKVAEIVEKNIAGKKITFSGEVKKGDPAQWQADISALINLGFSPVANFENCIAQYIEWYKKQLIAV